ncbi:MAG: hypothetical protein QXY39_03455 [Thermofilaceae archaeon]
MSQVVELGGYRYVIVRLSEIERLNRAFEKLYDLLDKAGIHFDSERYYDVAAIIYDSYLDHAESIIRSALGLSGREEICDLFTVADNERNAKYCHVLVRDDRDVCFYAHYLDVCAYDPDVYVREDVMG